MIIDYLCIGHCCHDRIKNDNTLGGSASYAALIAKELGHNAVIKTSVGANFEFYDFFAQKNISIINIPADETTVFKNEYSRESRNQTILEVAGKIGINHTDITKFSNGIIHLCPIADEIDLTQYNFEHRPLTGLSIQGLLRQWDQTKVVRPKTMNTASLKNVDIVFVSDEDIAGDNEFLIDIKKHCDHVVLTKGSEGATIFLNDQEFHYPSWPCEVKDPTGAGDAFATGYLLEFFQSKDHTKACVFAHCLASFIVEDKGLCSIPSISSIQKRIDRYLNLPDLIEASDLK